MKHIAESEMTNDVMFERTKGMANVTHNPTEFHRALARDCIGVTIAGGLSVYSVIDGTPMELDDTAVAFETTDDWSPIVSAFSREEASFIKAVFDLDVPVIPEACGDDFYSFLDLKYQVGYVWDQDVIKHISKAVLVQEEQDGMVSIRNLSALDHYAIDDLTQAGFSRQNGKDCLYGPLKRLPIRFIGNLEQSRRVAEKTLELA